MEQQTIPQGYKYTEVGVIPEDWKVSRLQELCSYINDGTHHTPRYVESGIPFYSVENVTADDFIDTKFISKEEHEALIKRCRPERGDILLTRIGTLAKTKLIDWNVDASIYVSLALLKLKNQIDPHYVYAYTKSRSFYHEVEKRSLINATPQKINMAEIGHVPIALPQNKTEQTAIATALSDVDSLIASLDKLIAKKQAIKTATMQQLLTGKIRLPAFSHHPDGQAKGTKQSDLGEIPEDWDVDRIGCVLSITTGDKNTQDKVDDGLYPFFVRSQTIERINSYSFDGEAVLTAGDGVGTGKIFHYINGKCDYHQRVYLMHNFSERVHGYYFYIYFSNHFYDRIMSMTAKSSVDSVRREMIADMLIALPLMDEQREIAKVLSDMDTEIKTLQQRLNKTQQLKQGMMQELLTGRTRLI